MSERDKSPSLRGLLARSLGLSGRPKKGRDARAFSAGDDPSVVDVVEPVYERLLGEATGGRRDGPAVIQQDWSRGERAVFTTRFLVDEFDSSGPLGLLATGLLDEAVIGFRLLGLEEHAAAVAKLLASGFDEDAPDTDVEDFAEDWYNLEDADPARVAYIRSHPEEFRT